MSAILGKLRRSCKYKYAAPGQYTNLSLALPVLPDSMTGWDRYGRKCFFWEG